MKKDIIVYPPPFIFYGLRGCAIQALAYFILWLTWCKEFWRNYTAAYKLQHFREKNNLPPYYKKP